MSHVSIYEKNWLDLVFEGKNKEGKVRQLASFAEDSKGELYTLVFEGGNTGKIYRIDPAN